MKMVKSLLLGSAAGLVAVAGAQAADLPVKAKAVEYVKVCSLYGAGFYYIPGTDTCIKIGGYVRTEWNHNAGGSFTPTASTERRRVYTRADATRWSTVPAVSFTFDVRSQTEYGTLRSYRPRRLAVDDQHRLPIGGSARRRLSRPRLHPVRRVHLRQDAVVLRCP